MLVLSLEVGLRVLLLMRRIVVAGIVRGVGVVIVVVVEIEQLMVVEVVWRKEGGRRREG